MATNRKYVENNLNYAAICVAKAANTVPYRAVSGDPVRIGQIPAVALTDADTTGKASVQTDGVFTLLVAGITNNASSADSNVAVNGGDAVYFDESKNPPLSKRATGGIFFGYVIADHNTQVVASAATTTTCDVRVGR